VAAPEAFDAFGLATWDCAARFTGVWQTGLPPEAASGTHGDDASLP
jgi:hypothetical protein